MLERFGLLVLDGLVYRIHKIHTIIFYAMLSVDMLTYDFSSLLSLSLIFSSSCPLFDRFGLDLCSSSIFYVLIIRKKDFQLLSFKVSVVFD